VFRIQVVTVSQRKRINHTSGACDPGVTQIEAETSCTGLQIEIEIDAFHGPAFRYRFRYRFRFGQM